MKHLKLYEEFESDYFSTYYEEISADQYNSVRTIRFELIC